MLETFWGHPAPRGACVESMLLFEESVASLSVSSQEERRVTMQLQLARSFSSLKMLPDFGWDRPTLRYVALNGGE